MPGLKQSFDRLRKRHGYTGGSLSDLMQTILIFNSDKISTKVGRIAMADMRNAAKKIRNRKEKRILLPEINEIMPGRSVFARKAVEKGTLITDTLRDSLSKNLRDAMKDNGLVNTRGITAGRVSRKLVNDFEGKIKQTFKSYTERDPKFDSPSNIHQIAVTEVRSSVNEIKQKSIDRLSKKNGLRTVKRWVHNKSLSRNPRQSHIAMEQLSRREPVDIDKPFVLPLDEKGQRVHMMHPHDPNAPLHHIVGCNCDVEYLSVEG